MSINYSVVYSKRKTLSIIIERDRSVVVRAPLDASAEQIAREVEKKKRSILRRIEHNQKHRERDAKEFVSGESLLYLGKPYKLLVIDEPIDGVMFDSKFIISKKNQARANLIFKDWYTKSASEIIIPKALSIAKQTGVTFNSINIRDLRYRWGSCTPKDNIHFNWRLIKAPMTVIEYIIVHELTHILEPNHTPEFWNRVKVAYPLALVAKRWLIDYGHELESEF